MDAMEYHKYAWWLAWRHHGTIPGWEPEDCYQTAMVGLLELWRTHPDAPNYTCLSAMRRAVWAVIREAKRDKRQGQFAPENEVRVLPALDDPEQEVVAAKVVQIVLECVDQLPDNEVRMVGIRLMGLDLRQVCIAEGWDETRARRVLKRARERLRIWLDALEITA